MKHLIAFALAASVSAAHADPRAELLASDRAFSLLSVDKGSNAAFLAFMTDDGKLFGTGNQPPIIGKAEAARRFAQNGNGDPRLNVLSWEPDDAGVSRDGLFGWTDGHWIFETGPDDLGRRHHTTGHYLTVWTKDAKGAWKVAADMGTTDPKR